MNVSVALAEGVYALSASFAGDPYYKGCQTTADTIVTVAPAQFKVTGGGWIGPRHGRTSFGFNAKSDVTGLRGQIAIRTSSKARFHGNTVLTLTGSGNTAAWTGTGKWNGVAGYRFTATVVDNGTSGKRGDTISLVVESLRWVDGVPDRRRQPAQGRQHRRPLDRRAERVRGCPLAAPRTASCPCSIDQPSSRWAPSCRWGRRNAAEP